MSEWKQRCGGKLVSAEEAVSQVKSGQKVVFGNATYPGTLWAVIKALARRRNELRGVIVVGGSSAATPWLAPGWQESFEVWDTFCSRVSRVAISEFRAQYCAEPFSFRNPDRLLDPGRSSTSLGADWAVIPVGIPRANGFCSFGQTAYANHSMAVTARKVIGVVQTNFPRTYGEAIAVSEIDYLVEAEPTPAEGVIQRPLVPEDEARASEVIGALASELIRDGDTIQIGTGTTPMAVESFLHTKNHLGVHSEQLGPVAVLDLVKAGVVTGKRKNVNPGKVVLSFLLLQPEARWQECLDFIHENPLFDFRDISYVNNMAVIAAHDNMVAVNGIVALDLRGQAVADHVGLDPISGLGGNLDFTIASHYSKGGRSVYVLLATAKGGTVSRIVPRFPEGAPVTCPSCYVDYLVTEHGVVNLEGLPPRKRADAIISVAHPDFQPELRQEAKKMFGPGGG